MRDPTPGERLPAVTSVWGLDLGEAEIAAVRLATGDGPPAVVDYAFAAVPASAGGRGAPEQRLALADLARRLHLRRVAVHAACPGGGTVLRSVELTPEDLEGTPETVRHRLLETLPGELPPLEIRYELRERHDESLGYRILSIPRESVERCAGLLAGAELERTALHAGALALVEAAQRLGHAEPGVAFLRIGMRVTELCVHSAADPERYRIPVGEDDLAAAVSAALHLSTEEAYDRLGAPTTGPDAEEIATALAAPLDLLAEDVGRLLEYHRSRDPEVPPIRVHPVGAVATRPAVMERLRRTASLRLEPLLPPDPSVLACPASAGPDFERDYGRLLPALGAAWLGMRTGEQPLVLRPLPPAPVPVRIVLHAVAAAIILLVALAGWAVRAGERRELASLVERQELLDREIPVGGRSPADLARDRARVERRLALLDRKTATLEALRSLDELFAEPREGESARLESLHVEGPRVVAVLRVRVPRGTNADAAAEAARTALLARLEKRLGGGATATPSPATGGYRLRASWEIPR